MSLDIDWDFVLKYKWRIYRLLGRDVFGVLEYLYCWRKVGKFGLICLLVG